MKTAIQVKGLTKKYNGFTAVDNISFDVKYGEIFAFLGPNGAGKSTTINILTTVLNPTSGKTMVNGFPSSQQSDVRKSFGIVFQDPSVDTELTAYENMEFHAILYKMPKGVRDQRIKEMLSFVGLWNWKNKLVKTFSSGMKRRLEIARGLIHHPKILFLDEPTLGLDAQTRNFLWKHVKQLNKKEGMTVFFTTHNLDEAERVAERIAIIDKGRIVAIGTTQDIKEKTKTKNLEDAFLKLTGDYIREEKATPLDNIRAFRRKRGL